MIDTRVDIFKIPIFSGNLGQVLEIIDQRLAERATTPPLVVLTPTTEQVVMAQSDDLLCTSFRQGDLNVPDTTGLVMAERLLAWRQRRSVRLIERIPGIDLGEKLCAEAAERGLKVFLIGGKGVTAQRAAESLRKRFRGLQIESSEGIAKVEREQPGESERVIEEIKNYGAEILLVAFGAPFQERWVTSYKSKLPVKVVMVVGGAVDVWAGKLKRAPLSWRKIGLEWAWRLIQEPWRIRRQLRLLEFGGMVIRGMLRSI